MGLLFSAEIVFICPYNTLEFYQNRFRHFGVNFVCLFSVFIYFLETRLVRNLNFLDINTSPVAIKYWSAAILPCLSPYAFFNQYLPLLELNNSTRIC